MRTNISLMPTNCGTLLFGRAPFPKTLKRLKGADCIWNLAEELYFLVWEEQEVAKEVLFGDIRDYDVPDDIEAFVSQLNRAVALLQDGRTVFVHCLGGRGRTGMALAVIKIAMEKVSADVAIEAAIQYAGGPESKKQVAFVKTLAKYYQVGT